MRPIRFWISGLPAKRSVSDHSDTLRSYIAAMQNHQGPAVQAQYRRRPPRRIRWGQGLDDYDDYIEDDCIEQWMIGTAETA